MAITQNKHHVFDRLGKAFRDEMGPPFPLSEYENRWQKVRERMAFEGLDGLWVSTPADICYLTGYEVTWFHDLGPGDWVPESGVFMHVDLEKPLTFEEEDERLLLEGLTHSGDVHIAPNLFSDSLQMKQKSDASAESPESTSDVIERLRATGKLKGTIGLQLSSYRPNRLYSEQFEAALRAEGAEIADGTNTVAHVSRYKSKLELDVIREAASIGDAGMHGLVEAVSEGTTELELWAAATSAMAKKGGELSAIPGMVNSGPKVASLHGYASRRSLKRGDLINTDMSGVRYRYHSNLARCIILGSPDAALRSAIDRVTDVARKVRAQMYPGMLFSDLMAINEKIARDAGIWEDAWWVGSYDLGIAFPPDWVGRFCHEAGEKSVEAKLTPGMVMNHEWNFYLPDGKGIRELIDTFIVTEDGIEFPHEFPIDLVVVD